MKRRGLTAPTNMLVLTDTETASLEGGVADIAVMHVNDDLEIVWEIESLIDPERPISPQAMGIHHITNEMVADAPTLREFVEIVCDRDPFPSGSIICGHNIQFDIRMLKDVMPADHLRLCTLKLARVLFPDLPDHKLQTIRYTFGLDAGTAHRAMGDVRVCLDFLRNIRRELGHSLVDMLALARKPLSGDSKMPFGKHQGMKLKELPRSYVTWLLSKPDVDPEIRQALLAL